MRYFRGTPPRSGRLGIFPGAFNPVTRAHLAIAGAAATQHRLDQVAFLLPQALPHKTFEGASFDERVAMLEAAISDAPGFAFASSEGGLVIEMARAFRAVCGDGVEIFVLCGRDAAERFSAWDYAGGPAFAQQLEEFQMLVASREGEYEVPAEYAGRIHRVKMPPGFEAHSSSAVRKAIETGQGWEQLVPEAVAQHIREKRLYQK